MSVEPMTNGRDRLTGEEAVTIEERQVRARNIQWTVSGDYDWLPGDLRFQQDRSVDYYENIIRGAIHRIYAPSSLRAFEDFLRAGHLEAAMFIDLLQIPLESGAFDRIKDDRPVVRTLRLRKAKDLLSYYDYSAPRDLVQLVRKAHAERVLGRVPKVNPMVRKLVDDLESLASADTPDLIQGMNQILKDHFHFNPTLKAEADLQDRIEREEKIKKREDPPPEKTGDLADQFQIGSAEFTDNILLKDQSSNIFEELTPTKKHRSTDEKIREAIVDRYGRSLLTSAQELDLAKRVCYGNHQEAKLFITDGRREEEDDRSSFGQSAVRAAYESNLEELNQNRHRVNREINRLTDKLRSAILNDMERGPLYSRQGKLVPSRIWRADRLNDARVFEENSAHEPGKLVVDLLIDASASQTDRRSEVAIQAFILASALDKLNIPFRATSFQSQQGYTIIRQYLDYRSPDRPDKLLEYCPNAANRDGFALRITRQRMKRSPSAKNVIIVLSDGRPNDRRSTIHGTAQEKKPYTDRFAIEDTAREVRLIRQEDIPLLGVFTGKEEDLEAARTIFGRSFAYVKKIERFSEIVSNFLKDELVGLN